MLICVQRRAAKLLKWTPSYEKHSKEHGIFNLEKKLQRGDRIAFFKYLKGYHIKERGSLFSLTA